MNYKEAISHPFASDKACAFALYAAKWPTGYFCPRCNHRVFYKLQSRKLPLYECRNCRHQTSLLVGTIFENSKTSLSKWFRSIYLSSCAGGINATELSQTIKVTYKTAWLILHKIRHTMMSTDQRHQLSGMVRSHVDCYGRPYNPTVYQHPQEHPLIAGASLTKDDQIYYVKIKQVSPIHLHEGVVVASGLDNFIKRHTKPGTINRKDICKLLNVRRYRPLFLVCKQVKHWINETFHGIGAKHLQAYLDEYCYRLNLHAIQQPIFKTLLSVSASSPTITYTNLIKFTSAPKQDSLLPLCA